MTSTAGLIANSHREEPYDDRIRNRSIRRLAGSHLHHTADMARAIQGVEMTFYIRTESETLSDGSDVYNVYLVDKENPENRMIFHAVDDKSAHFLMETFIKVIQENTVDNVKQVFSE